MQRVSKRLMLAFQDGWALVSNTAQHSDMQLVVVIAARMDLVTLPLAACM